MRAHRHKLRACVCLIEIERPLYTALTYCHIAHRFLLSLTSAPCVSDSDFCEFAIAAYTCVCAPPATWTISANLLLQDFSRYAEKRLLVTASCTVYILYLVLLSKQALDSSTEENVCMEATQEILISRDCLVVCMRVDCYLQNCVYTLHVV